MTLQCHPTWADVTVVLDTTIRQQHVRIAYVPTVLYTSTVQHPRQDTADVAGRWGVRTPVI